MHQLQLPLITNLTSLCLVRSTLSSWVFRCSSEQKDNAIGTAMSTLVGDDAYPLPSTLP